MSGIEDITYRYDSEKGIMYKLHYGNISIEDIINSWEWAFDNKIIPDNTSRFLLDYREAIISSSIRSSSDIVKYYHENPQYFKNCKFAIVSFEPKNVAISFLVRKGDKGYESRPFSSIEKAIEWLTF